MINNRLNFILMLLTAASAVLAAPENKPDWPKGIDPATLRPNTDPEPDLTQSGFVDLFNGVDLSGWNIQGGKMRFEVKDGVIIGTCVQKQPNGFLCTEKNYSDYIFTTEFKWGVPGNSGIMFRAGTREEKPGRVRVFGYQSEMDQTDRRWTGGIFGEAMGGWKYPLSKPEGHAEARAAIVDHAAWNRMTIQAQGNVLKTWINGVPCAHLVNDERRKGFFGLQVHSGKQGTIHWRNIRVKELDADQAWTDLFESGSFAQWATVQGKEIPPGWRIEDGVVHRSGKQPGDILTKEKFDDFELTFEWKISKGGNSGVKYRTRGKRGLEYQILDDENHRDRKTPTHRAASLYDLVAAPDDKPLHPPGSWNKGRIVARGTHLEHWLNDVKVVEIDQSHADWHICFTNSKYRKHEHFGTGKGPVLLQDHGNEVWYRQVRIRAL